MNVMRSNIDVLLSNITNAKIDVDELIRNSVWVRHTFRHGKARLGSAWRNHNRPLWRFSDQKTNDNST